MGISERRHTFFGSEKEFRIVSHTVLPVKVKMQTVMTGNSSCGLTAYVHV